MSPSSAFLRRLLPLIALLAGGLLALPAEAKYYHCRNADGSDTYQHHACSGDQQLLGLSAYLPGHEPAPPRPESRAVSKPRVAAPVDSTSPSDDGHPNVVYGGYHADAGSSGGAAGGQGGGGQGWNPGAPTLPQAYKGDGGSWFKQFFVKLYSRRCNDAMKRSRMMNQWSPQDADTFCRCVGATLYDSSINYEGLKQAASSHGKSMEAAANEAGERCVNGPDVPKWQGQ